MPRFLPSPVGGYGTWSPAGGDDPVLPVRLQGERPTLAMGPEPVELGSLPRGELDRFLLDGEPVDLFDSVLEAAGVTDDRAWFTVLLPEDQSPGTNRLLRLRYVLEGVAVERTDADLLAGPGRLRRVDAVQHDGGGGLRLSVYADPFAFWQHRARTMAVEPAWVDARQPPYVKVMWDYSAFGVWDEGPGMGPFEPTELDLAPRLRDRIQAWCDRCEDGDEDPDEQDAIADELRAAWPDSVVRVHR